MPYAEDTQVGIQESRREIAAILARYGGSKPRFAANATDHSVYFRLSEREIELTVPMPALADFTFTPARIMRSSKAARAAYTKEVRRRYRALALVIKAKLEAIASGISSVDREFLAALVLPNGQTAGEWIEPTLVRVFEERSVVPFAAS